MLTFNASIVAHWTALSYIQRWMYDNWSISDFQYDIYINTITNVPENGCGGIIDFLPNDPMPMEIGPNNLKYAKFWEYIQFED